MSDHSVSMVKEIAWPEAETLAGERVDRRRKYARDGKQLLESCHYTTACSGCFEAGEYGGLAHRYAWDEKAQCRIGFGCEECGYTGKRRWSWWVPYVPRAWR